MLDWLTSDETSFLEYLLRYLRHAAERSANLDLVECAMPTLIRLRLAIIRLKQKGLFPYDPDLLIRRLSTLETHVERR
jgi:hypothetical protein